MSTKIFEKDGNPIRFKICYPNNKIKRDLTFLIKMHGGELVERYADNILLICPDDYILTTDNCLSYNYIYKCIEEKKLLNTENYRLDNIRNKKKLPELKEKGIPLSLKKSSESKSSPKMSNISEKLKINDISFSSSESNYNFSFDDEKFQKEMDEKLKNYPEEDDDDDSSFEFEFVKSPKATTTTTLNKSPSLEEQDRISSSNSTTLSKQKKKKIQKTNIEQDSNISTENLNDSLSTNNTYYKTNRHSPDKNNSNSESESPKLLSPRIKDNIKSKNQKSFILERFIKNITTNSQSNNNCSNQQENNEILPVNDSCSDSESPTIINKKKTFAREKSRINLINSPKKSPKKNKLLQKNTKREKHFATNRNSAKKHYKNLKSLEDDTDSYFSTEPEPPASPSSSSSSSVDQEENPERLIENCTSSDSSENGGKNRKKMKFFSVQAKPKPNYKIVRRPFTLNEDLKILHYIIENNYFNNVKGKRIWKLCVENKIIENRHYDTLECRFRKHILKNINDYAIESKYKKKFKNVEGIKPFKDNISEIAIEMKEEEQKSRTKFRSKPYSEKEDYQIIKKVCEDGNFRTAFSRSFWVNLEKIKFLEGRTHHSLENRFRRTILCNLDKYTLTSRQNDILHSLKKD